MAWAGCQKAFDHSGGVWWCSREGGHEGPCAARPVENRPIRIRSRWQYNVDGTVHTVIHLAMWGTDSNLNNLAWEDEQGGGHGGTELEFRANHRWLGN